MWTEIKTAPNLMVAEMWKELFEGEGVPTRILPQGLVTGEGVSYRILVPELKKHIIEEILRKL